MRDLIEDQFRIRRNWEYDCNCLKCERKHGSHFLFQPLNDDALNFFESAVMQYIEKFELPKPPPRLIMKGSRPENDYLSEWKGAFLVPRDIAEDVISFLWSRGKLENLKKPVSEYSVEELELLAEKAYKKCSRYYSNPQDYPRDAWQ